MARTMLDVHEDICGASCATSKPSNGLDPEPLREFLRKCPANAVERIAELEAERALDKAVVDAAEQRFKDHRCPFDACDRLVEVGKRAEAAEAERDRLREALRGVLGKLPNERHDYSGVGRCAGCGAVLYVSGDGLPRDPCKPDCVLTAAHEALKEAKPESDAERTG